YPQVIRVAIRSINARAHTKQHERLWYQHFRSSYVESSADNLRQAIRTDTGAGKLTQPTLVVRARKVPSAILDSCINIHHLVLQRIDRNSRAEDIRGKNNCAVFETDLCIFELICLRLALLGRSAARVVPSQSRYDRWMLLIVTVAHPEVSLW